MDALLFSIDEKKAFKWYSKAAEQGIAAAQFSLGACYDSGVGVAQNEKLATEFFLRQRKTCYCSAQSWG